MLSQCSPLWNQQAKTAVLSMGLSLTAEKASMKLPEDHTHNPTPLPFTKIPPTEYKYQASFIHLFIPSFTHPVSIYYVPNAALTIRKTKISKNRLCS